MFNTRNRVTCLMGNRYELSCPLPIYILPDIQAVNTNNFIDFFLKKLLLNRAPIVAKCDRKRVLSSWAPYCSDMAPAEFQIEFSSVRHLSPRQFVEKLSKELGVGGVVAGKYN